MTPFARFLGEFIAGLTEQPERLEQTLPGLWRAQMNILYLENFFNNEEIRRLVELQAQEAPNAAWVEFNRYRTAGLFKEGKNALFHLARAVTLDRIYAKEYLKLAEQARGANMHAQALQMLKLAYAAFPDDVLLKLQIAETALQTGDKETANALIKELQKQP